MGVIAHKSAVGFSGVFLNDNGHMQCDREITSIFSLLSSTSRETRTIWGVKAIYQISPFNIDIVFLFV